MQSLRSEWIRCRAYVAALAACVLVACGADQVAGIQGSGAPVAGDFTTIGPISGFGSIFVDGQEYATSGAQVRIDDQVATESQLRVGQIVTLRGSVSSGGSSVANEVSFTSDVKGPVAQIDISGGTFTVLGQTVRITDGTLFDDAIVPADLSGLSNGVKVQVSGTPNAAGDIVATRVDVASATDFQVKGLVQSLDTVARTFRINALLVDYSAATVVGTLEGTSRVVVRGSASGTTFAASRVQVVAIGATANASGRVEGVVTAFVSNADFSVNGQRVLTDSSTELVLNGLTLGLDSTVKVRGTFNASGALVASRVELKAKVTGILRGVVDSVSAANGTLTVLGVTVTTGSGTSFEDRSTQRVRLFRLSDINVGDYVEVRGTSGGTGLSASLVERDRPEQRVYVQGVARLVLDPSFSVLGVTVMTDAQTRFLGLGGQDQARLLFFTQAPDHVVRVRGTVVGGVFVADQAQIRN